MSEAEWRNAKDTDELLRLGVNQVSPRKQWLFICACARQGLPFLTEIDAAGIVDVAERVADGQLPLESDERSLAMRRAYGYQTRYRYDSAESHLTGILEESLFLDPRPAVGFALANLARFELKAFGQRAKEFHVELVRDIFGNPFRPVDFAPWRTDTALALARQMYDSRDFGAMPILADALQDAGCDNDEVLGHCRAEAAHFRGCWVVDGVLGLE